MKTFIILNKTNRRVLPEKFQSDDNRNPENLVEYFLEQYTKKGDTIIDIFAGLGTMLFVAEELERIPYGIEYDPSRFAYIKSEIRHKNNIIHGDARNLDTFTFPKIDFAISSPPYMHELDLDYYALTAYTTGGTYEQYLKELREIYAKLRNILKPNATVVIEVSNLKRKGAKLTTLAWDVAKSISKVLHFEGEVIVGWEGEDTEEGTYGCGYDHSYCLIFRNRID
ncbi:MAG: DNA methyltransferase [Promethearchaeota archaeon]